MPPSRSFLAAVAICLAFLLFLPCHGPLSLNLSLRTLTGDGIDRNSAAPITTKQRKPLRLGPPDIARYKHLRILSADEFPLDDRRRRVIIVGDIHGMKDSLDKLLKRVAYDGKNDVLVHAGDILTKADHDSSMRVLQFMTANNITGVRGNHDQLVIEWKGWLDWINGIPDGRRWLAHLQDKWLESRLAPDDLDTWVQEQREECNKHDANWWRHVPKKWAPFGDHYQIAKNMTEEQYAYLLSLPLKLYIPSAHTFIVHAGLLPYDLRYPYDDRRRQPLAKVPTLPAYSPSLSKKPNENMIQKLRRLQEEALLRRVPQNTDPWANLNVRGVLENLKLTRKNKGTPWSQLWNHQMSLCNGYRNELGLVFDANQQYMSEDLLKNKKNRNMPCYPSSVLYGHSAAQGLDINRWTIGLDSGCVYGRRLTALVLGPNPMPAKIDEKELSRDNLENYRGEVSNSEDVYDDDDADDGEKYYETRYSNRKRGKFEDVGRMAMKKTTMQTVEFGDEGQALIVSIKCPLP